MLLDLSELLIRKPCRFIDDLSRHSDLSHIMQKAYVMYINLLLIAHAKLRSKHGGIPRNPFGMSVCIVILCVDRLGKSQHYLLREMLYPESLYLHLF